MFTRSPEAKLSRAELVLALKDEGYDISPATLASFGSRGGGPDYDIFNGRARYTWGSSLAWAKSRVRSRGRRFVTQESQHAA